MNQWVVWGVSFVLSASSFGCGSGAGTGAGGDEETASAIALQLDTIGNSGTHYRLGPAKFEIVGAYYGSQSLEIEASGAEDTLHVPVDPGLYNITLEPGWQLQTVADNGSLTPIAATLVSQPGLETSVTPFKVTNVNFGFHLGASALDIGVSVDEGLPAGYDGQIVQLPDGRYMINWANGGGVCCFSSVDEIVQGYPQYHFLLP